MHVIWDWNGTLFDDLPVVVDAVNASIAKFRVQLIDEDGYRTHYQRPVRTFYESLVGRPLTDAEWFEIDDVFHGHYRDRLHQAGLTHDAFDAIDEATARGSTQSLLSMWAHDELVPAVLRFGVAHRMVAVQGSSDARGARKASYLRTHLGTLSRNGHATKGVVMIGDSLDDADAAAEVGIRCVLYDGGSHHYDALAAKRVPIAPSLVSALTLALDS